MRWQRFAHGYRSEPLGTLRRYHALGVWSSRAMQRWIATVGTLRRYHPSGSDWGSCADGTLRRYHGLWVGNVLHVVAGRYRSGRFAIPCVVCVADRGLYRTELSTVGSLRRYFPFLMRTRRLGCTLAGNVRCSVVGDRTTVGLNRLGVVRVQTWMFGVYLAHRKCVSHRRVITQRAATQPCSGGNLPS